MTTQLSADDRLKLEQMGAQALAHHRQGREAEAEILYRRILALSPGELTAGCMLGAIRFNQQKPDEAVALFEAALAANPGAAGPLMFYASLLTAAGRLEGAISCFDRVLALDGGHLDALIARGNVLCHLGRFSEALAAYNRALMLRPNLDVVLLSRGIALRNLGRGPEALASFDAALAANPGSFDAWFHRANGLRDLKRLEEALASHDKALAINPAAADVFNNRGNCLRDLKRFDEALASFDRALALEPGRRLFRFNRAFILSDMKRQEDALKEFDALLAEKPDDARAHCHRGLVLDGLERFDEAMASYDRAIAAEPGLADGYFARAEHLTRMGRFAEALESYNRVLQLQPGNEAVLNDRGFVLQQLDRFDEALASFNKALAAAPDHAGALYNRGNLLWLKYHRLAEGLKDLEKSFRLEPDRPYLKGDLLHLKIELCAWDGIAEEIASLNRDVANGERVVRPSVYMAICESAENLGRASRIYAADRFPARPPLQRKTPRRPGRIRLGYVGQEFREHAMAFLLAGLFEHHDKDKFELIAFDAGWDDGSAVRRRLTAAFDQWIDLSGLSDRQKAEKIRDREIDILVNISGYYHNETIGPLAYRPAPVQVHYLGFPTTMGAPYIDYMLVDRIVVPEDERHYCAEKTVYLPDSYWVNDSRRAVTAAMPSRRACGLPEQGLVFCNFNHIFKLTPKTFAVWMDILRRAPASVLWLLESNDEFVPRLRAEAQRLGVAGERLIFAKPAAPADHLARIKLADLCLDSLPYNAHTTACDCLWVGVPVLTCRGTTFPGRVAASLLEAADMKELITENYAEYTALALRLAGDPAALAAIRRRLEATRLTMKLFDTARFCRHIEAAYGTMWELAERGEGPRNFEVPEIG